jgi:hypothetical protein
MRIRRAERLRAVCRNRPVFSEFVRFERLSFFITHDDSAPKLSRPQIRPNCC